MALVTDLNYALENRLIRKLDLMIQRCVDKELRKDAWMIVHGGEGEGKSNTSFCLSYYVRDKTRMPIHLFFRLEQLLEFVKKNKKCIVWWDEPALDSLSSDHMKEVNKNLLRLAMTIRKRRHFFFINFTKFWKFSEYITVDRALGLLHMYSRKEVEPGRFVYIKKSRLEALWTGYKSQHKRLFRQLASIRGRMPDILEKHFDKADITIHGVNQTVEHATFDDYEEQKDQAIESIGEEKMSRAEKYAIRLQYKIASVKKEVINRSALARALNLQRKVIVNWANLPQKYPWLLEK